MKAITPILPKMHLFVSCYLREIVLQTKRKYVLSIRREIWWRQRVKIQYIANNMYLKK